MVKVGIGADHGGFEMKMNLLPSRAWRMTT